MSGISPKPVLFPFPCEITTNGARFCADWLKIKPFSRAYQNGEDLSQILLNLAATLSEGSEKAFQQQAYQNFKERFQLLLSDQSSLEKDLKALCELEEIPALTGVAEAIKRQFAVRRWVIQDVQQSLPDLLQNQSSFSVLRVQYLSPLDTSLEIERIALNNLAQAINTPLYEVQKLARATKQWKKGGPFSEASAVFDETIYPYLEACHWYYTVFQSSRTESWENIRVLIGLAARTHNHLLGQSVAADSLCKTILDRESQLLQSIEDSDIPNPLRNICLEDSRLRCLIAIQVNYETHRLAHLPIGELAKLCEAWQAQYPHTPLLPLCEDIQALTEHHNPWALWQPDEPEIFESHLQVWLTHLQINSDIELPKIVALSLNDGGL